jgi:DNA-binding MarR family transcriptional regulator
MLSRQLLDLCRRSRHLVVARLATLTERPYNQLRLLQAIDERAWRNQTVLAEHLCIDRPATSRLIERLHDDGLLRRPRTPSRTELGLSLTAAGRRELQPLLDAQAWLEVQMREILGDIEIPRFQSVLARVAEGLQTVDTDDLEALGGEETERCA